MWARRFEYSQAARRQRQPITVQIAATIHLVQVAAHDAVKAADGTLAQCAAAERVAGDVAGSPLRAAGPAAVERPCEPASAAPTEALFVEYGEACKA